MLNRQQIYDIYYQGYEPTPSLVQGLLSYIQDQEQAIGRQQQITISDQLGKIKWLQSQLKRTKAELSHQRYLVSRLTDRVQQLETALQQQAHTTTTGRRGTYEC